MVNISAIKNGKDVQNKYSSSFVKSGILLLYGRSVSIFKESTGLLSMNQDAIIDFDIS
ncbi:MAG: hypothetical protein WCQ54_04785 [Clostridiaceae bacterium]